MQKPLIQESMMHCKDWEERVALHVGGDLAAAHTADAAGVERHLAECAGCRMFWAGIKESLEMLQGAHAEAAAPGIYTAVRGRVLGHLQAELEAGEARRRVWWRRGWVLGLAAAVAVMVVLLASWPGPKVEMLRSRVVAMIPPAPPAQALRAVPAGSLPHKRRVVAAGPVEKPPRQPLMVRLVTDDPNVIIYWIAD
jgi:predicted anti-sigma-YlaC factor YlaD